ncbi:probable leucine-rich repeat receptor-like protein kinase At1g68400 [Salvia hispanica]|uniref:probable leucine-rich repeat receptor-like protein kinase At1g68400 n=1 Tax=Salvia hispanica TaxID=49212 RepID=UPI002008F20E|nr:probable leucine-rich repeat receptor-like protein kinase At1g68400 [Salvia hispanica]
MGTLPSIFQHPLRCFVSVFSFGDPSFEISRSHKLVLVDVEDAALASVKLLGAGTFGSAYVAMIDDQPRFVVKRLESERISELDFRWIMEILGDVRHENVVALRAYYSSDYYSNDSVHSLLHALSSSDVAPNGKCRLETRVKIAIGAAKGIAEIHKKFGGMLVHGNIKASNIFLNQQLYGCVCDFVLSNMTKTRLKPTSSDVYTLGILLLELLTRKNPAAVNLVKLWRLLADIDISNRVSRSLDSTSWEVKLVFLEDVNVDPVCGIEYLLEASAAEVIGKGSFGNSYKITLDNGSIVVVKRCKYVNPTFKDFQKHVELFGRMNHTNIGRLKAFYYSRYEKLLLYDYYTQGCISSLHGNTLAVSECVYADFVRIRGDDWVTRVKIAFGAARGIAHVHGQDQDLVLGNIKPPIFSSMTKIMPLWPLMLDRQI